MERIIHHQRIALALLLAAAAALGAARPVAAQDANAVAPVAIADEAATSPASATGVASTGVTRLPLVLPSFEVGPALDNPPGPGDAFPMEPWGNTE